MSSAILQLKHSDRGDTIIEVLISIAILSVILVGAYVTSNESLVNVRNAQEHSEAISLAQSQLEDLSAYLESGSSHFNDPPNQCLTTTASGVLAPFISFSGACYFASNNISVPPAGQCLSNVPYCYRLVITSSPVTISSGTTPNNFILTIYTYTVTVDWDAIGGGQNQVQLVYRDN